jgi:hypothetical protein
MLSQYFLAESTSEEREKSQLIAVFAHAYYKGCLLNISAVFCFSTNLFLCFPNVSG